MSEYRYEGEVNESRQRHGEGRAYFRNGDEYHGHYEHGKRHGFGSYRFHNGAVYEGHWENGRKNGQGVFTYPDGAKYNGFWLDDERSGYGVYWYANGDVYVGQWSNHTRHGNGRYVYTTAKLQFVGRWVDGHRDGIGQLEDYFPELDLELKQSLVQVIEKTSAHQGQESERHEDEGQRHEDEGQRHEDEGQRHEDEGQRHEDEGQRHEDETQSHEDDQMATIPGGETIVETEGRATWWAAQKPSDAGSNQDVRSGTHSNAGDGVVQDPVSSSSKLEKSPSKTSDREGQGHEETHSKASVHSKTEAA